MPCHGTVGDICNRSRKAQVEWKIDIPSLSKEVDDYYKSPRFDFAHRSWNLLLYPNGSTAHNTEGWIGLFLSMKEICIPVELEITLNIETAKGEIFKSNFRNVYENNKAVGLPKTLQRSELFQKRDEVAPLDTVMIIATLETVVPGPMTGALFSVSRHDACMMMMKLSYSGQRSDVVLKLGDSEFRAHRMILESRSPVFHSMFNLETEEKKTGVVTIPDIEPDIFKLILSYMYYGEVDEISSRNVYQVFVAADKYDLRGLKGYCIAFMRQNLSEDTVCSVLLVADKYDEKKLKQRAKEYFVKNAVRILDTDEWEEFASEYQTLAIEILSSVVRRQES